MLLFVLCGLTKPTSTPEVPTVKRKVASTIYQSLLNIVITKTVNRLYLE